MFIDKIQINQSEFPTQDHYPFNLKVFQETSVIEFSKPITFFAGENGSGKSTLLTAIARKCNIHIWHQSDFPPLIFNKYADQLYKCITAERGEEVPGAMFLAQSFRRYAELVDEWAASDPMILQYYGGESLALKSHGQTNMQYFNSRFKIKGLYLLDEPEAALSPKSQVELLQTLKEVTTTGNVQFIIATHSPLLLGLSDTIIYNFNKSPITTIKYKDTDYYRIYRDYLIESKG